MDKLDQSSRAYVIAEGRYRVEAELTTGLQEEWEELERRIEVVDGTLVCTRLESTDVGPAGTIAVLPPGTKLVLWPPADPA